MIALLEFESVDAGYGGARILRGVSFDVGDGDSLAVLGRNGVGKTTIVNTLLGVARRTAGVIRLNGAAIERPRAYSAAGHGVSVVIQGRGILPNLTVEENLLLGAAVRRKGLWSLERVFDLFPVLKERADTPGCALSGGQQQMLAIGRALMANPRLLVLDEPSEGLAPVVVDELAEVLNLLRREGAAVLLIEQNLSLVERVVRRFCVLSKGAIVDRGDVAGTSRAELQKHIAI